jgi:hypothetical protein
MPATMALFAKEVAEKQGYALVEKRELVSRL